MARDGNGSYSLPEAAFVYGDVIDQAAVNNNFADIGTALTDSLAKDGQTTPTGNLPMGGYRHTGVANGTARDNYAAVGQVQDGTFVWCGTAGGTANALTLTPSPAVPALVTGMRLFFRAGSSASTGAVTIVVSALAPVDAEIDDAPLSSSVTLEANKCYIALYDGNAFQLTRLSAPPEANYVGSIVLGDVNPDPAKYISRNGATLNRATYAELWSFVNDNSAELLVSDAAWLAGSWGSYSGGDGSTTFRLPDWRGEFLRFFDDGRGVDSGRVQGAHQADELKSHFHAITWTNGGGGTANLGLDSAGVTGSVNSQSTGGTETRPRNITVRAFVRFEI